MKKIFPETDQKFKSEINEYQFSISPAVGGLGLLIHILLAYIVELHLLKDHATTALLIRGIPILGFTFFLFLVKIYKTFSKRNIQWLYLLIFTISILPVIYSGAHLYHYEASFFSGIIGLLQVELLFVTFIPQITRYSSLFLLFINVLFFIGIMSLSDAPAEPLMSLLMMQIIFLVISFYISYTILKYKTVEYMERQKLEETNRTKDKFFSIIAHDLKNPLGSFRDTTEILVRDYENFSSEDRKEFLSLMNSSAKQLYSLLENLLDWSRSQTGKIKFNPEITDIASIINNTLDILRGQAEKKCITLSSETVEGIMVEIDMNMITTVIRNLASNAIKFTPAGGEVVIGIDVKENFVDVFVKDNGTGISPEDIIKLFRIDSQHTTMGTANEKGTGLGLILCKEFIEKHKSTIDVESTLGKGSCFKFSLTVNNY